MRRFIFAVFLASLLASPALAHGGGGGGVIVFGGGGGAVAWQPPPAEVGNYNNIHRVAVLSALGQSLRLITGVSIWDSKKDIDVTNWRMDDFIEAYLARRLSERFAVKQAIYDRAALAAISTDGSQDAANTLREFLSKDSSTDIDAFVLVRPDDEAGFPYHKGLSILMGQHGYSPQEWLGFDIEIIDAHTFQRIGKSFAQIDIRQGTKPTFAGFFAAQDRNLSDALSPDEHQLALYRSDFAGHLPIVLVDTLSQLKLGLSAPTPGNEPRVPIPDRFKPFRNIHNVAIISAVGDSFALERHGSFFVSSRNLIPISDWNLDADIEAQIASALDKRFTVKALDIDRTALANDLAPLANTPLTPYKTLKPTSEVDAYILVLKLPNTFYARFDPDTGIGLLRNGSLLWNAGVYLFANYSILVVDAQTLKPLTSYQGVASPAWPSRVLLRRVDDTLWVGDETTLTPQHMDTVRGLVFEMMHDSVGETLMNMGLTPVVRDLTGESLVPSASKTQATSTPAPMAPEIKMR